MPIPTYDKFIDPLLRSLAEHPDGVEISDAYERTSAALGLADDDLALLLPSGRQAVYKNRIGWAHDYLKRGGLSASPKRGFWQLTPVGLALARKYPQMPDSEMDRILRLGREARIAVRGTDDGRVTGPKPAAVDVAPTLESPDERIERAIGELGASVAQDLLERISQASPLFFENLVLELLHKMGYGADRAALQRVGGSGDGGIDGIISLDRLGLQKVYVQAKRWQAAVGSPEIQGFMGALQLQGASSGVILTTSTFTKDAWLAATKARGTIVLVDGTRLTALMIEHGVAVTHKTLRIPKIDGDFFEDG